MYNKRLQGDDMKIRKTIITILVLSASLILWGCDDNSGSDSKGQSFTPGAPTVVKGDQRLFLTWNHVSDATFYEVWYNDDDDSSTATPADQNVIALDYTLTGLTNGTTYYVWLIARNPTRISGYSPSASGTPSLNKIYYNANDGIRKPSTVIVIPTGYADTEIATVELPDDIAGPLLGGTHEGSGIRQRLVTWNTQADGAGTTFAPGTNIVMHHDWTLYAVYTTDSSALGKRGPAWGWVFYDAGSTQSWGRYIEAAVEDLPISMWQGTSADTDTYSAIGTADTNTANIIAADNTPNIAADRCSDYTVTIGGIIGGTEYTDWYLPAGEELAEMYDNLKANGIGHFANERYWTSLQYFADTNHAYYIDFTAGSGSHEGKTANFLVRPIRYFDIQ